jgi:hypothetical protein
MSGVTSTAGAAAHRPAGQPDVAVVEHRRGIEQHLEHQHRRGRRAEHGDHRELDQHREDDLDRMEACAGGDVVVGVGVVHLVQAPQQGHRMDHDVLQPDGEVHGRHREHQRPHSGRPGC